MRILLIDQYFWPDMPGYFAWAIGRQLAADGHHVTVLSMQPSYNSNRGELRRPFREDVDGLIVVRVPTAIRRQRTALSKLLAGLILSIAAFWAVARGRYDAVRFATAPPVMLGLAVVAARRVTSGRTKLVYHCQDLFPEILRPDPKTQRPVWFRILRRLDAVVSRASDAIVVLSSDMAETMASRGVASDRIVIINNPSIVQSTDSPIPDDLPTQVADQPLVLFAGNLGNFQGLDQLIDAAHLLEHEPLQICLMGEGPMKEELRRKAGALHGRTVHFLPFVAPEIAFAVLQRADVAVISIAPGVYRAAYPSKTTTALMAGCRLVVIAERESELVRTTLDHDLGTWARRGDPGVLAAALRREAHGTCVSERRRIMGIARARYSHEVILPRWTELFERIAATIEGSVRGGGAGGGTRTNVTNAIYVDSSVGCRNVSDGSAISATAHRRVRPTP